MVSHHVGATTSDSGSTEAMVESSAQDGSAGNAAGKRRISGGVEPTNDGASPPPELPEYLLFCPRLPYRVAALPPTKEQLESIEQRKGPPLPYPVAAPYLTSIPEDANNDEPPSNRANPELADDNPSAPTPEPAEGTQKRKCNDSNDGHGEVEGLMEKHRGE
jgi:hypothetical protein